MRNENNVAKWVIFALVIVIIILLGIIAFFFWIGPSYQEFISGKQQESYNAGILEGQIGVLSSIVQSVNSQGYVQIPLSEDQVLFLAPFDPNQVGQPNSQEFIQEEPIVE